MKTEYPINIISAILDDINEWLRVRRFCLDQIKMLESFEKTIEHGTIKDEVKKIRGELGYLAGNMNSKLSSELLRQFLCKYGGDKK